MGNFEVNNNVQQDALKKLEESVDTKPNNQALEDAALQQIGKTPLELQADTTNANEMARKKKEELREIAKSDQPNRTVITPDNTEHWVTLGTSGIFGKKVVINELGDASTLDPHLKNDLLGDALAKAAPPPAVAASAAPAEEDVEAPIEEDSAASAEGAGSTPQEAAVGTPDYYISHSPELTAWDGKTKKKPANENDQVVARVKGMPGTLSGGQRAALYGDVSRESAGTDAALARLNGMAKATNGGKTDAPYVAAGLKTQDGGDDAALDNFAARLEGVDDAEEILDQFDEETKGMSTEKKWEYLNSLGGGKGGALVDAFEENGHVTGLAEGEAGEITDDDRRTKIRKNLPEENRRKEVASAFSDIVEREKRHKNPLDPKSADAHKKAERARKLVDGYKPGNARSELALVKGLGVTPTDEQVKAAKESPRKGVGGALDTADKVKRDVETGADILGAGPNMVTKGIEDGVKLADAVTPGDDVMMQKDEEKFEKARKEGREMNKEQRTTLLDGLKELLTEAGKKIGKEPQKGTPGAQLRETPNYAQEMGQKKGAQSGQQGQQSPDEGKSDRTKELEDLADQARAQRALNRYT